MEFVDFLDILLQAHPCFLSGTSQGYKSIGKHYGKPNHYGRLFIARGTDKFLEV